MASWHLWRLAVIRSPAGVSTGSMTAPAPEPEPELLPREHQRVLWLAGRLATAETLEQACRVGVDAVREFGEAERGYCVLVDAAHDLVWSESGDEREWSAERGLIGAVARTGGTLVVEHAGDDPRFVPSLDDPEGDGRQRLMLVPLCGDDGVVHAVLVAARSAATPAFGPRSRARLGEFARRAGPMLEHLSAVLDVEDALEQENDSPFRAEALDEHRQGPRHGDVVRVTPGWIGRTFWVIAAAFVAGVLFIGFASLDRYSSGVGVVRARDRVAVVTPHAGTVDALVVSVGQRVAAGDVLVRLDAAMLRDELRRLDAEHEVRLRNRMLDPRDEAAAQAVMSLASRREAVADQLREREIRAPRGGRVIDVRAQPGHAVAPGDVLLTVGEPEGELQLWALLPGDDRPQMAPGMHVRFQIPGYRHGHQWFPVVAVDDAVVGPQQAARMLGPQVGDSVPPIGASVLVRATIPRSTFSTDLHDYRYHDGMVGMAEVRLEREPLFFVLFPFLEPLRR